MMPIVDKYTDMGTVVIGKVESGQCSKGQMLAIYPNRTKVKVDQVRLSLFSYLPCGFKIPTLFQLWSDDIEVTQVECGENIWVKVKGVEEADISPGFVQYDPNNPIGVFPGGISRRCGWHCVKR